MKTRKQGGILVRPGADASDEDEGGAVADDEGLAKDATQRPRGRRLPKRGPPADEKKKEKHVTIAARVPSPVALPSSHPLVRGSDASVSDNDVAYMDATSGAGTSDSDHHNNNRRVKSGRRRVPHHRNRPHVHKPRPAAGRQSRREGKSGAAGAQSVENVGKAAAAASAASGATAGGDSAAQADVSSTNDESNSKDTDSDGSSNKDEAGKDGGGGGNDNGDVHDSSGADNDSSSDGDSGDDSDDDDNDEGVEEVSQAEIRHAIALASEAAAKTFGWDHNAAKSDANKKGSKSQGSTSAGGGGGEEEGGGGGGKNGNNVGGKGNALSGMIPGYTAPMRLEAPAVSQQSRIQGSRSGSSTLTELRRRAERTDASTAYITTLARQPGAQSRGKGVGGASSRGGATARKVRMQPSSFKYGPKGAPDNTAGSGWFGMVPTPLSDDLKTDLAVIRNRSYLDPKRFYKSADRTDSSMVQVGTVIEGNAEYYSSRLTKRQRRANLTEEIMADASTAGYARNQFRKVQTERAARFGPKKKKKAGGGGKRRRGGF